MPLEIYYIGGYMESKGYFLGGVHVSSAAEHVMAFDDFEIIGEDGITMYELLESLESDGQIEKVHRLAYRDNGSLKYTPVMEYIEDLDVLPFPAYHLIKDVSLYTPPQAIIEHFLLLI